MSKRKKEILKRKKLEDQAHGEVSQPSAEPTENTPVSAETLKGGPPEQEFSAPPPVDDSEIISAAASSVVKRSDGKKKSSDRQPGAAAAAGSRFNRNKENFLLGLLILYVLLLGLGTVGELFEIEWILNLPLFR